MKKKFSLWLNIVTICLCVCAIAIGVYAATSATLTVSGQIGFKAHGCEGTVSGTIVGHAEGDDKDAMPTTTPVSLGDAVDFGQTLSYGTSRYFTDMATIDGSVTPITIVLTVTNKSLYPIEGQLVLPETDFAKAIDFDIESGLVQLAAATPADDNTDVGTITITMKLKSTATNYADPVALNFTIEFNKYEQIKGDSTNGFYMTMGSNVVTDANNVQQVQPVKWIPFAESSDGATWTAFVNTNKPDSKKQYYFVSEKILDIGETTVYGTSPNQKTFDAGITYNPYCYMGDGKDSREGLTSLYGNLYLTSNVRDLLQGEDAYKYAIDPDADGTYAPGEETVNLMQEYGITGFVFDKISKRSAESLYGDEVPDTIPSAYNTDNDKLWLLSSDELKLVVNDESYEFYNWDNQPTAEQKAILKTKIFRQEDVIGTWWLRSVDTIDGYAASFIDNNGECYYLDRNLIESWGIRPAFQIDLSK